MYLGHQTPQWTRTRNPKKFFGKRRTPTSDFIERKALNFNPTWESKQRQQHSNNEIEQTVKRIRNRNIKHGALLLVLAIVATIAAYSVFQAAEAYSAWTKDTRIEQNARETADDEYAYNYLTNSGYKLFRVGQLNGAESEFRLAINIYPERTDANIGLAKALTKECVENFENCTQADMQILKVIELTPENEEMQHLLFLVRLAPELTPPKGEITNTNPALREQISNKP